MPTQSDHSRRRFLRNVAAAGAGGAVASPLLAAGLGLDTPAHATVSGNHYAIISGKLVTKRSSGYLDVAIDPEIGESLVHFRLFVDGVPATPPTPVATVNGFASSGNIHAGLLPGKDALLEARVEQPSTRANAVLYQSDPDVMLGIGPAGPYTGRVAVALGELRCPAPAGGRRFE